MESTRGYELRDKGSIPLWGNSPPLRVLKYNEVCISGYGYRLSPRQQADGITPL